MSGPPVEEVDQSTADMIALCNAGYGVSLDVKLKANVEKIAKSQGALSVAAGSELRGLLLNGPAVTEDNVENVYKSYLNCVSSEKSTNELLAILNTRSADVRSRLREYGRADLVPEFNTLYEQYIFHLKTNNRVAAHETVRTINEMLVRAQFEIAEETGESVNFLFSKDDPTPKDRLTAAAEEEWQERIKELYGDPQRCVANFGTAGLNAEFVVDAAEICGRIGQEFQRVNCEDPQTVEEIDQCIHEQLDNEHLQPR